MQVCECSSGQYATHLIDKVGKQMTAYTSDPKPSLTSLIIGDGTPKKALLTALVVGSVLTAINHGDAILAGQNPPLVKVLLTYCVPYCVTTWGAVTGKMSQLRRQQSVFDDTANARANSL